jgi:Beta-galactosidase trimerisation domain
MADITRRDLMKSSAAFWVASRFGTLDAPAETRVHAAVWARHIRTLIAEGYNPPFYPLYEYDAERTATIATALNCDSLRYPAASHYAYFPTESGYPTDPRMKGDPMRDTLQSLEKRGLRSIAYIPLNNTFMSAESHDPRYADWTRRHADGTPMITGLYGFNRFFEGCINSPIRQLHRRLVQEVVSRYDFDVIYFDGPYQGMQHMGEYCYCEHCERAFRKQFGKPIPAQASMTHDEDFQYRRWLTGIVTGFFRDICAEVREQKTVPILFNDTALLTPTGQWRDRCLTYADGFMFEASDTPEQKLFNLQLGQSTGKAIWTYIGSYQEYSRAHLRNKAIRGWFSYPLEGQQIAMDCAIATAAGAGCKYWGLSRFFYQPEPPTQYPEGRYLKAAFDFQAEHRSLLDSVQHRAQAGVLVSDQTIKWYRDEHFVLEAYSNYFHGSYLLLKALNIEPEPFLDWLMSPEVLSRYSVIYLPCAVCLSDSQCEMLRDYVRNGGHLVATHLTSAADEYGHRRSDFALADLFGASLLDPTPFEYPDLYLKPVDGPLVPQDPQIVRFRPTSSAVLAYTLSRGQEIELGPAIATRTFGKGKVIYIGSGLEAVFYETLMEPLFVYLRSLLMPLIGEIQPYRMDYVPGLIAHCMTGDDRIILHVMADLGNRHVDYTAVHNVRLGIRVPRKASSVSLLQRGTPIDFVEKNRWIEVVVPEIDIYEAVCVELTS